MSVDDKNQVPMEDVTGVDQAIIDEIMAEEGGGAGAGLEPSGGSQTQTQTQTKTQVPPQTTTPAAAPAQPAGQQQQFDPFQAYTSMQQQMQQMAQVLQQLSKQPQTQPAVQQQPKDEDPLAAMVRQHLETNLPKQLEPIQQLQQQIQQQYQQQQLQARIQQSVATAQAKYVDFEEVATPIHQRMMADPAFNQMILNMPDPAEYAYLLGLGMKAQAAQLAQGQAQFTKMQQMAAMPRSMQVKGGGAPTADFDSLEDMIDNFDKLTPAQQAKLLKLTNRSE